MNYILVRKMGAFRIPFSVIRIVAVPMSNECPSDVLKELRSLSHVSDVGTSDEHPLDILCCVGYLYPRQRSAPPTALALSSWSQIRTSTSHADVTPQSVTSNHVCNSLASHANVTSHLHDTCVNPRHI